MYVASGTQTLEGLSKGDLSTQKSPSRVRVPEAMYMSRLKALQRAACQLKKSPTRVRVTEAMYVSRLKALRRAACQLKKALQGFEFRKQRTCRGWRPFEGQPVNSKKALRRAFNPDTYVASGTQTLERLFWVDRPPLEGPSTLTRTLLPELEPLKGFCELTGHPSRALTEMEKWQNFYSVSCPCEVKLISSPKLHRNSKFCFEIGSSAPLCDSTIHLACSAPSKFVRLCCCGAGCLVNYSCLCQCCCIPPIQCCLLAIRWIFVNVLDKFVDLSRPFLKVALRGRFSRPRGRRGRPTQSQQILHVPKSLRHPRHSDPIPR